jgi:hypothetical protein
MAGRQSWIDGRVDVLLAELKDLGMSASRAAITDLVQERVQWVASQTGVTPAAARRYLTDDALRDLARTMVISVADETPGADILAAARSATVPVAALGRCIAGLAEAMMLRLVELDDLEHVRTTCAQLAQALSAIGQVVAELDGDTSSAGNAVMMPPALVNRAARYLEAAATLVSDGVLPPEFDSTHAAGLAATFSNDAASLRYYAGD